MAIKAKLTWFGNPPVSNYDPGTVVFVSDVPGTYEPEVLAGKYRIYQTAAGGGAGLGFTRAGAGASGGTIVYDVIVSTTTKLTCVVGTGGRNSGISGSGYGGDGENTTVKIGNVTYIASGGQGGQVNNGGSGRENIIPEGSPLLDIIENIAGNNGVDGTPGASTSVLGGDYGKGGFGSSAIVNAISGIIKVEYLGGV